MGNIRVRGDDSRCRYKIKLWKQNTRVFRAHTNSEVSGIGRYYYRIPHEDILFFFPVMVNRKNAVFQRPRTFIFFNIGAAFGFREYENVRKKNGKHYRFSLSFYNFSRRAHAPGNRVESLKIASKNKKTVQIICTHNRLKWFYGRMFCGKKKKLLLQKASRIRGYFVDV